MCFYVNGDWRGVCRIDVHFVEYASDGSDQRSYVLGKDVSDGTNSEAIRIADFAWINDEAAFAQFPVKEGEIEATVSGKAK